MLEIAHNIQEHMQLFFPYEIIANVTISVPVIMQKMIRSAVSFTFIICCIYYMALFIGDKVSNNNPLT